MREFAEIAATPVATSAGDATELGETVAATLNLRRQSAVNVA
jgi:hypothetical protein